MRDRSYLPLMEVISARLGPPRPRLGGGRGRPWWPCPFHPDRNPSLSILPSEVRWRCFGCNASGDSIDLIRRFDPGLSFAEARAQAEGFPTPDRRSTPVRRLASPPPSARPDRPTAWGEFARAIAEEASQNLRSGRDREMAHAYLAGGACATRPSGRPAWATGPPTPIDATCIRTSRS